MVRYILDIFIKGKLMVRVEGYSKMETVTPVNGEMELELVKEVTTTKTVVDIKVKF
jgi:hypothetical protein